jgi:DNA-directed RNA polymerase subunit beta
VQFDTNDLLYIYLDRRKRRRKFLATTFLRSIGFTATAISSSSLQHREAQPTKEVEEDELNTQS